MEKRYDPLLQEELYFEELPSGLTAFVLPKKGYQKKFSTFATHYGSIDNHFKLGTKPAVQVPDGIAHFLEHKLFEGPDGNAADGFAELGASSNASTSFTSTTYLFSATENYEASLELLLDFVQTPYFTTENVTKEQGIIAQEIRMYQDDPRWRVFHNLLTALFHQMPARIDIAGTVDSIMKIDAPLLDTCYKAFYHPTNMTFFAVGDVDPGKTLAQVAENLARHKHGNPIAIERILPREPNSVFKEEITEQLPVNLPLLELGFKEIELGKESYLKREILTSLLLEMLFGRSSEIYAQLYESGLINEHFSAYYYGEAEFGTTVLGGETPDPNRLQESIYATLAKAKSKGLSTTDFERVKRRAMGEFVSLFNSPEAIAYTFNSYYFKGYDFFTYRDALQSVTLKQLEDRLHEHFLLEHSARSYVLPR